jgi:GTP-binding protein EngB required for normal cell division
MWCGEDFRLAPDPHTELANGKNSDDVRRMGKSLGRYRHELLEVGGLLSRVLGPAGADTVNKAVQVLDKQVCRVAVIGQIKAGKSTFINAFVQRPQLLPTGVNPWTTTVTNLHFRATHDTKDAAVFQFFSEAEWEQLANGQGKLRELTEHLVPGFKPELLRWYVSALQTRAATRLGPEFTSLLGRRHRAATLSPDLLQQYVCQGDPSSIALASDPIGRYSDITKSADVYLPGEPFDYPGTVVDTPGTNDPFLIRDEITRRSLETADLYIVVLTARQALSAADVALLRILRGLNKDQIVVFINRIDELSEIAEQSEAVTVSVRRELQKEFPGADIPLIAGSARWANFAITAGRDDLDRCIDREAIDYLRRRGVWPSNSVVHALKSDDDALELMRGVLFKGSGLEEIYRAIDGLLAGSRFASAMRQMNRWFVEMTRASEASTREELQSFSRAHSAEEDMAKYSRDELARLRGELERLQRVSEVIDRSATLFKERQMEIVTGELVMLRLRLLGKVDHYAAMERSALVERLLSGKTPRAWSFDTQPIRRELAEEFTAGFHQAEAQLLTLQREIMPQLRDLLSMLVPEAGETLTLDAVRRPVPPPRLMSLSSSVSLDLDSSWWWQWWKREPTPLQRGREVEQLIREEFGSVVDELLAVCRQNLGEYVAATAEWSFGICESIAQSISRRRKNLLGHYERVEQNVGDVEDPQVTVERDQQIAAIKARLEEFQVLRRKLELVGDGLPRETAADPIASSGAGH